MGKALPLSAGFGRVVSVFVPVSYIQLTASNTAQPVKVRPGVKGRVVGCIAQKGTYTFGTSATDFDMTVRKGTTALHSVPVPVYESSAEATTGAVLSPTLVAAAATRAIDVDDYLSAELELTGGSTPVINGAGFLVYIARE